MPTIRSNRDLYRVVTEALKRRDRPGPPLEIYLWRLREAFLACRGAVMTSDAFAAALDGAFDGAPATVEIPVLRHLAHSESAPAWHRQLARQMIDLHEMAAAGTLEDGLRYFGVDAPSGARWYNFDPHAFVECGLSGTFSGWEADDDTGRVYVPGKVAVLGADGKLAAVDPEALDEPPCPLETVDWDAVEAFLWAGQQYE